MRKYHKPIALVSFLFIFIISLAGLGLGYKSAYYRSVYGDYRPFESVDIGTIMQSLSQHSESPIHRIYTPARGVWVAQWNPTTQYSINPKTATVENVFHKKPIFELISVIHTQLLLGKFGKYITVFMSVLLILTTISGFMRALKRQGGFRTLFVRKWWDYPIGQLHTMGGAIATIPILIIATTGSITGGLYLANIQPDTMGYGTIESTPSHAPFMGYDTMPILQKIPLKDIQEIVFPLANDTYDVITVQTHNQTLYIDRYSGAVIGQDVPSTLGKTIHVLQTLHTTNQNPLWMFIWMLTSVCICMLCITGVYITIRRWRNPPPKK